MSNFEQLYCPEPYCDDPENPGFPRPVDRLGYCATHRRQLQRTGKVSPIAEKLNPEERAIEAASRLVEADSDNDAEYNRRRKALLVACRALGQTDEQAEESTVAVEKERAEYRERRRAAALKGLERARRQGTRIGRPRKSVAQLDLDELVRGVHAETGSVSATARALSIDRKTVRACLGKKASVTPQFHPRATGPRKAG